MSGIPLLFVASTAIFLYLNYEDLFGTGKERIALPSRSQLPKTVYDWRNLLDLEEMEVNKIAAKWPLLDDLFQKKYRVRLWLSEHLCDQRPWPSDTRLPKPNGYNTLTHANTAKSIARWACWCPRNGAQHVARTSTGCDVMVRVLASGGVGENYLQIQRYLNKTPEILLSNNHVLPMLEEMVFEDISFGVFPRVDASLLWAFNNSYTNSLEDVLYMLMEALEGVVYLHHKRVAHQDLFLANFVIQWQPESIIKKAIARPRVWIIDFEDSVMFSEDIAPENMRVPKFPRVLEDCGRPQPPEVYLPEPYCPFKVDVWQFGRDLKPFDPGFDEVTQIFADMRKDIPEERITAAEALNRLEDFVRTQPPMSLHRTFPGWV